MRPPNRDHDDSTRTAEAEQTRVPHVGLSDAAPAERIAAPSTFDAGNAAVSRSLDGDGPVPSPVVTSMAAAGNAAATRLARRATVQRAALAAQGAGPLDQRVGAAIDAERGRGAPLPEPVRADMEPHLGADLSAVRVHTGSAADTLNRAVTAQAFTTGTDVFFGAGRYNPTSPAGRELLAHELTHVVQQASDPGAAARVSHPDEPTEVDARAVARRVARDAAPAGPASGASAARSTNGMVARQVRTVARAPDRDKEEEKETAAVLAVAQRANKRAAQITALQGSAIKGLKASSPRLLADSKTYEKAHKDFVDTLDDADKDFALEQKATDLVQDILVGTIIGLLGPAGLAARVAIPAAATAGHAIGAGARAKAVAAVTSKAGKVLAGLIDEGLEPVANWPVAAAKDAVVGESSAPGESAGLAGPTPGERYKAALAELDNLIDFLPDFTPLLLMHQHLVDLAIEAGQSGDAALADLVTSLDGDTAALAAIVTGLDPSFTRLVQAITSAPVRPQAEVERMLWMEWVPRLSPPFDQLNYRVIRQRLETVGLSFLFERTTGPMTGDYSGNRITPDSANQVSTNAKAAWLQARGVPVDAGLGRAGGHATVVDRLFEAGAEVETLERARLVGRRGTLASGNAVVVDGATYAVRPSPVPHGRHGDAVIVEEVFPDWHVLSVNYETYLKQGSPDAVLARSSVGLKVTYELRD
jgi:hypothetical protein